MRERANEVLDIFLFGVTVALWFESDAFEVWLSKVNMYAAKEMLRRVEHDRVRQPK